jgi:hypothetical protein
MFQGVKGRRVFLTAESADIPKLNAIINSN